MKQEIYFWNRFVFFNWLIIAAKKFLHPLAFGGTGVKLNNKTFVYE
ncbi:MAG TPA: hypothetical protein VKC90_16575 [Chitinophagaceae bacterium]|nr:hypothetical protein [Chitinophagaceae bacterium]